MYEPSIDESDGGDDDREDDEGPDDHDLGHGNSHGGSVDTDPCPYCGKPVYEQAEVCPHCGSYISTEDAPRRKPLWIVVAVVVVVAVMIFWCKG